MIPKRTRTLSTRRIYNGRRVSLRVDRVQIEGRPEVEREVVEHPGSVVVLPVTERKTVLLVRQWRHAVGREMLEAPAGTRDHDGETPEETAQRELQEETGYGAGKLVALPGFWMTPGWCNELMLPFIATGLEPARLPQDEDEDVHLEEVRIADAPELIRTGAIQDAKTILLLLYALQAGV